MSQVPLPFGEYVGFHSRGAKYLIRFETAQVSKARNSQSHCFNLLAIAANQVQLVGVEPTMMGSNMCVSFAG